MACPEIGHRSSAHRKMLLSVAANRGLTRGQTCGLPALPCCQVLAFAGLKEIGRDDAIPPLRKIDDYVPFDSISSFSSGSVAELPSGSLSGFDSGFTSGWDSGSWSDFTSGFLAGS